MNGSEPEVDLAGPEDDAVAAGSDDDEIARVLDPVGDTGATVPGDRAPAQRVALAPGGEDLIAVRVDRAVEATA